jgi:uncharacterized caspase-like protein
MVMIIYCNRSPCLKNAKFLLSLIIVSCIVFIGCATPTKNTNDNIEKERVLVSVPTPPTDMFIFFSTQEGKNAEDGEGRNSPFAEAFLKNINKNEPLITLAKDIVTVTYNATRRRQTPTYETQINNEKNKNYSIANKSTNKRYALLIGNSNYRYDKLKNAINDVQDIAKILTQLDFDVDIKIDANRNDMQNAIIDFKRKLSTERGSEGFFWYAGSGFQNNGEKYLIPIDKNENINNPQKLIDFSLSFQSIINDLNSANNNINLFFIDASFVEINSIKNPLN